LIAELTKGSEETRDMKCCGGGDKGPWRTSLSLLTEVETEDAVDEDVETPNRKKKGQYRSIAYRISVMIVGENCNSASWTVVHERE
jgi:hypothetical protein